MTQDCCEGLYHTYKALVLSHLLLCHHKLSLMKLEISLPQLVGLASDFNTLMQNDHLQTHSSDHQLLIFIRNQHTQMHTVPLVTATGRTRVTTCRLIAWEPYKGSSKNKNKKLKNNSPHLAQYMQTCSTFLTLKVDNSAIVDPVVSACPCFLGCSPIS